MGNDRIDPKLDKTKQDGAPDVGTRLLDDAQEGRKNAREPQVSADGRLSFPDGSAIQFDKGSTGPRVLEVQGMDGAKTKFQYKDGETAPKSYSITDANGKEIEKGTQEKDGKSWKIEKADAAGKLHKDKSAEIVQLTIGPDGRLDLMDKNGLLHERMRNGDRLLRMNDSSGRILEEKTWNNRTTTYTYDGQDAQPTSFTVKDGANNIAERGVRKETGWDVYKPKEGQAGLDPKKMENPDNLMQNPRDRVTAVEVDVRSGKRVEVHADGSRTWQAIDNDRSFRRNVDGTMTVTDQSGGPRLLYIKDGSGTESTFDYDKRTLTKESTREKIGGQRLWTRDGTSDTWRDQSGRTMTRKADLLLDGSVQMTYPERKAGSGAIRLTQHTNGSEMVEKVADGQAQIVHTTDAHGKQTDFRYEDNFGTLMGVTLTFPTGQKETWSKGEENGQEVWTAGKKKLVGSVSVEADGSLLWNDKVNNRQVRADMSGLPLDVTPRQTAAVKPEAVKK